MPLRVWLLNQIIFIDLKCWCMFSEVLISVKMKTLRPHTWNPNEIEMRWNNSRLPNPHTTAKGTSVQTGARWSEMVSLSLKATRASSLAFSPLSVKTVFSVYEKGWQNTNSPWNDNREVGQEHWWEEWFKIEEKKSLRR